MEESFLDWDKRNKVKHFCAVSYTFSVRSNNGLIYSVSNNFGHLFVSTCKILTIHQTILFWPQKIDMKRYGTEILPSLENFWALKKKKISIFFCFFRAIWQKTQKIRKNETIWYGKEIVAMLENFWALVENFYFLYCTTDWLTSKFCRCLPICWCM